jgi:hypothetical protein
VYPAALLTHLAPDLADGFPEAEGAIRDDELGHQGETMALQIEQQLLPRQSAFTDAISQTDQFFFAVRFAPMMTRIHCASSPSLACT